MFYSIYKRCRRNKKRKKKTSEDRPKEGQAQANVKLSSFGFTHKPNSAVSQSDTQTESECDNTQTYVAFVISEVHKRLPQASVSTLNDLNVVLNPGKMPKAAHALIANGKDSLQRLCNIYGQDHEIEGIVHPAVINSARATQDFFPVQGFFTRKKRDTITRCLPRA